MTHDLVKLENFRDSHLGILKIYANLILVIIFTIYIMYFKEDHVDSNLGHGESCECVSHDFIHTPFWFQFV
jgi:hypothetical protein